MISEIQILLFYLLPISSFIILIFFWKTIKKKKSSYIGLTLIGLMLVNAVIVLIESPFKYAIKILLTGLNLTDLFR